jgi:hypothetical protein
MFSNCPVIDRMPSVFDLIVGPPGHLCTRHAYIYTYIYIYIPIMRRKETLSMRTLQTLSMQHQFGNLGKTIAEHVLSDNEQLVLVFCPWTLIDDWVQMVVPPLPQLLRRPMRQARASVNMIIHCSMHR